MSVTPIPHRPSQRELMAAGSWYDANFDADLVAERRRMEGLCHRFNSAVPHSDDQVAALRAILGDPLPEGLELLAPVWFDYGGNTHLGTGCFVNHGCYFMDGAPIDVGDHAFIGPGCKFCTATHPLDASRRNAGIERALPISIGRDCWIGASVTILAGVTIGAGCVIAAGSVVTADVPPRSLAAGVPATVRKSIVQ
ncbi:sugar O-acetyltransferase [Olsenella massiliensis]|uniref:sugar O-acetyltransferase n=1 Tax=Olsenella massiliensis TaxID=1622075 RepID=UPI00071C238B|nr:sugar O-acetyltransferase [Olsenella massiliensis]